jgi:hydroxyacylglutathione hydrolase
MLQCNSFTFNPFQENTYILSNSEKECILIDPGCYGKEEERTLAHFIKENLLEVQAIWLTHCHIDHVLGLEFCIQQWKVPYFLSEAEISQLHAVQVYGPSFGIFDFRTPGQEGKVFGSERIFLGDELFEVIEVPGHSPGHVAFLHRASSRIWSGDVLFDGSIGRTDLPGGHYPTLEKSILEKIYALPLETQVFPGHGHKTTVEKERMTNPFIRLEISSS